MAYDEYDNALQVGAGVGMVWVGGRQGVGQGQHGQVVVRTSSN